MEGWGRRKQEKGREVERSKIREREGVEGGSKLERETEGRKRRGGRRKDADGRRKDMEKRKRRRGRRRNTEGREESGERCKEGKE